MLKFLRSFFPDKATRTYKRNRATVAAINDWYERLAGLSDEELRGKTAEFRERLAKGAALDDLLPEAFAVVKHACRRLCGQSWEAAGSMVSWEMVPFDVQLVGGIELHRGNIAEMATGEGKTLVGVMPLYLNALEGKGAHLVTVNDYLAKRDSQWMGRVFEFLGLTVGCILTDMPPHERRKAYGCDITYGTNNEFGFDYLRDNMAHSADHLVQRGYHYAIVDEVDSVLIDEARTPLIISGSVDRTMHEYEQFKPLVVELVRKQTFLVNKLVAEAADLLKQSEAAADRDTRENLAYEAGVALLRARRGLPKHPRLAKIMSDAGPQRLVEKVEHDFMRDKRMPEIDAELFFAIDEKNHSIDLEQKGREAASPDDPDLFLVPDLVEGLALIEGRHDLPKEERDRMREALMAEHDRKTLIIHCLNQLLRAYALYVRDKDYLVDDNKVIIIDEFTGRQMKGRRWSDGLHQAVEAKEGVKVEKETQTLATITVQNYFRMYKKLAGMTGTAETEASEFGHTYKMDVAVIPTNRKVRRFDDDDLIYKTQREKFGALVDRVKEMHASGMPILVGTASVEASEKISRMLKRAEISHNVLNAKHHAREAEIVREAGRLGAVTIATNMAGRGTDIKLGPGVVRCRSEGFDGTCCGICPRRDEDPATPCDENMAFCGLQIVGTERHESRRIDRQLRGRSGRQGDPGYSQFYLSLEDDLMRLFASDRMANLMAKGMEEGEAMQHGIATHAIGTAQKRIEEWNFERRKKTLEYDNVMNKQREAIYGFRRGILVGEGALLDSIELVIREALAAELDAFALEEANEDGAKHDWKAFFDWVRRHVPLVELDGIDPTEAGGPEAVLEALEERVLKAYATKVEIFGPGMSGALSRFVMLQVIDTHWRDHLLAIDELREGIYLRSYGQQEPLTEYQREATHLFQDMMYEIHKECFEHVFRATIVQPTEEDRTTRVSFVKAEAVTAASAAGAPAGSGDPDAARPRSAPPAGARPGAGAAPGGAAPVQRSGPPPGGRPGPDPASLVARATAAAAQRAAAASAPGSGADPRVSGARAVHADAEAPGAPRRPAPPPKQAPVRREASKVKPNDPCPCGSGAKFKKCCGAPGARRHETAEGEGAPPPA